MFGLGFPILTYHKLGPRPSRVRLKGLYLKQPLFAQQLAELRNAKIESNTLDNLARSNTQTGSGVIITFDDAYQNVFKYGLEPLEDNHFTAIQFVVVNNIGKTNDWDVACGEAEEPLMDKEQIKDWLAAGHQIGSHTLTHAWLSKIPDVQAKEEIFQSKAKLEDMFGVPVDHFCYPYGDWTLSILEYVKAAGYKTACTTRRGINLPETPLHALRRFTARYQSRNFKAWFTRLLRHWRYKQ